MGGIEGTRSKVAPCAGHAFFAVDRITRAKRVAVVFHEPELMAVAECFHGGQIERISKGMGDHDRLGFFGKRALQKCHVNVVLRKRDVHENRYGAELKRGGNRRREAAGHRDDLIASLDPSLPEERACKRHEGQKVRGRTGVYQRHITDAEIFPESFFESFRITAGRQPEIKRRIHEIRHFPLVIDPGRIGDAVSRLITLLIQMIFAIVGFHFPKDLSPCFLFCHMFKHQ